MDQREQIVCPLCDWGKEELLFLKDSFRVVRCKKCRLVYINPRLTKTTIEKLYNKNEISPKEYYTQSETADKKAFRKRIKVIERFKKRGKMLDVGCNIGTFLEVAKERNWDCYGIDINKSTEKECKKKGIKFTATTIEKAKFKKESFDVVILNDVLEHVHEPKKLMRHVYELLKKEGIVFIVTPDAESITAKMLRKKWHHLKPNEHLTYFSRKTMKRLMDYTGLDILYSKHIGRERSVGTILEKGESMIKLFPKTKSIVPKAMQKIIIPFNTFDELCVVAKKR